ncbi:choline/ethanolamine kinase family protein [Albidovulum sediminis]|uniref:Phosphotransferase family protein n=1 Tax=Albidovulum sediminis TaxID=3066345 RepID=A0ABT2NSX0_9RHOB|nr:choline/ethanolamine kinase family protein [Defluviimonas sediminis]MCT8332016.1 phosphotransferase family protein [Defluviimonas sediminis]
MSGNNDKDLGLIQRSWGIDQIVRHIAALDLWRGPVRIEPMVGGLTNHNFIVRDAGTVYVARVSFDMPAHDLYQPFVATVMNAAANAGISPRLHYQDDALTIMDFLPGGALRPDSFADASVLEAAIDLLKRLHGLGSNLPGPLRFCYPPQKVRRYYAFLDQAGSREAADAIPEFEALCTAIEAHTTPFVPTFVHMDLSPQNFVFDEHGILRLIDWDYGGVGHPMADLASMTINGDIARSDWQRVVSHYLGKPAGFQEMKLFSLFCVVVSLMEYLWASVQKLVSHLPGDTVAASMAATYGDYAPSFEGYCELNLDRFRRGLDEYRETYGPLETGT